MPMKDIKIRIQIANKNEKPIEWPYPQLPRIGDKFCFEVGVHQRVKDVFFNHVVGGSDFVAVVVLEAV